MNSRLSIVFLALAMVASCGRSHASESSKPPGNGNPSNKTTINSGDVVAKKERSQLAEFSGVDDTTTLATADESQITIVFAIRPAGMNDKQLVVDLGCSGNLLIHFDFVQAELRDMLRTEVKTANLKTCERMDLTTVLAGRQVTQPQVIDWRDSWRAMRRTTGSIEESVGSLVLLLDRYM